MIKVENRTNAPHILHSFDGDSVQIPPHSKTDVDDKFADAIDYSPVIKRVNPIVMPLTVTALEQAPPVEESTISEVLDETASKKGKQ